ncbi:betaine--homocysteine S-methyltransferase 1-like isoform X2 [Amphiura filiformis]|uniref:betaine--homocysteine S-methyltransferase 1-like isoform X2 n=1 Tax=Amphiura filiformis TaxID=82378 RepID=UPI003B2280A8
MASKKNLLERLESGLVIGDGSFVFTMEKRGYVAAGPFTPEAAVLYPDAVRQLHREYLRAGSDVMQTFTFYSSDDKLQFQGVSEDKHRSHALTSIEINDAACDLAREVANEGDALVAGGLSPVPSYREGKGKEFVQEEFRKQCKVFREKDVDFLIGEFFASVEEAEWAIEVMKELKKPVACTMRICTRGDWKDVKPGDCAVRMAKAGADVVGVNCCYEPNMCLETMALMKAGLDGAGLKAHLIAQPVGFHTEEIGTNLSGYAALPDYPFAMETRMINRFDAQKFARKAYELGVRYIGGCCGFEPYHIRAMAEELAQERGKNPPGADMSPGVDGLKVSVMEYVAARANKEYWANLIPAAGRKDAKNLSELPRD